MSKTRPRRDARSSLEQQRKRAKELLRACRNGDVDALTRVRQQLPPSAKELKLADAQHVLAREAGFDGWASLKLYATQVRKSREALIDSVLEAALRGHRAAVDSALAIAPDLPLQGLHVAAALADEAAVTAQLARASSEALSAPAGPLAGSPLAYVCHARLGREQSEVGFARARIAKALLRAGADANECIDAADTPAGKLSVLTMAARHAASPELVTELLTQGAVLEPSGSTGGPPAPPLVGAAMGGNLACVEVLLKAGSPVWQAREALEVAVERNDADMVQALLAYGCLPDQAGRWRGRNGSCLHAALALGRDTAFIRLLLDGGASVAARDRDGRAPLSIAIQLDRQDAAELLRQHGAQEDELSDLDRLLEACFARDRSRVEALLRAHPKLLEQCSSSDHQNVCRAVRRGDLGALDELLFAGFDPNVPDDDGQTSLHLAVQRRDLHAIGRLLAKGATPDLVNYDNVTAKELVASETDAELSAAMATLFDAGDFDWEDYPEQLEARLSELALQFERALGFMSEGNLAALRELLAREPHLARARSHRFHCATLLHYLGNNGTERTVAPTNVAQLAALLLERGAVVDASCRMYGGGPHQTTLGLAATTDAAVYPKGALAELLSTLVRAGAKVHEADGRSRALEGAIEYGAAIALRALAAHGARAYDLATAAALGHLELLRDRLANASHSERVAALENAAVFSHLDVLEALWAKGAELDAQGAHGATALHRAAAANAVDSVRWLLEHGADAEAKDRNHQSTPADWARHFGSEDALLLLTRR